MNIEICTNSFRSAKIAVASKINRVELCQSLEVGGITPSAGDIRLTVALKENYDFEVHVLIRARGGDFCFSPEEYEVMRQDILFCIESGVDGVVIGGLTPNGNLDIEGMQKLIAAAGDMEVTLHRAFDYINDPIAALETAIDLGFARILTSGQKNTAIEGKEMLKHLIELAAGRITIMPGGGVSENNIKELISYTGANDVHFTAKELAKSSFQKSSEAAMSTSGIPEYDYWLTNGEVINRMKALIK
jgi:copper homeostasis protein